MAMARILLSPARVSLVGAADSFTARLMTAPPEAPRDLPDRQRRTVDAIRGRLGVAVFDRRQGLAEVVGRPSCLLRQLPVLVPDPLASPPDLVRHRLFCGLRRRRV